MKKEIKWFTIAELARRIGQSRQNLYKELQRETLSIDEIKQIADALGVVFEQSFTLPDGNKYTIRNEGVAKEADK